MKQHNKNGTQRMNTLEVSIDPGDSLILECDQAAK